MPNARQKPGESAEEARLRYNAEMRAYRAKRKSEGRPLPPREYNYEKWRAVYCKRRYGITFEEATDLLASQGGCCAICKTELTLDNRDKPAGDHSAIDHCHTTGRVRGILCMHCNQGLGKFRDSPENLQAAIDYLTP